MCLQRQMASSQVLGDLDELCEHVASGRAIVAGSDQERA
jgi:hypothetical protein